MRHIFIFCVFSILLRVILHFASIDNRNLQLSQTANYGLVSCFKAKQQNRGQFSAKNPVPEVLLGRRVVVMVLRTPDRLEVYRLPVGFWELRTDYRISLGYSRVIEGTTIFNGRDLNSLHTYRLYGARKKSLQRLSTSTSGTTPGIWQLLRYKIPNPDQMGMQAWLIPIIVIGVLVVLYFVLSNALSVWAAGAYKTLLNSPPTECDIDAFVGPKNPVNSTKVVLAHKFRLGSREASLEPIPLEVYDSPHVPGLKVSRKAGSTGAGEQNVKLLDQFLAEVPESSKPPVVIGTIRMGFGHHRIAYSAASWAVKNGHPTIFHDLLNIESPEAKLIKETDELYSKFSRYASEMGGAVERFWGSMMLSGDANALRIAALTAAHLQPLLLGLPPNCLIITSHQLVALTAAAAGFRNVVNLVVDNHPQWFLVIPRTLNLVQGPVNYQSFLKMGVRADELHWAGHWCPADLVDNIEIDCKRRILRAEERAKDLTKKPLRLLIPVGGAGAQRKFIINFVRALADYVKAGKVQLFLNAGDHSHMKQAFLEVLDQCSIQFDTVTDTAGVKAFQEKLLDATKEPNKAVTLFTFDEYFPAVATTDILCRVADILSCKPSELAFYCIPKLHIRRVGDHEADSAKRASELGDGTVEARELEDALDFVNLFLEGPDLLKSMNQSLIDNHQIGHYFGCKRAVEMVVSRGHV